MSTKISRRDFLKLGGLSLGSLAFTPALNRLPLADQQIGRRVENLAQVEAGTEFQLGASPVTPFLKYSFDLVSLAPVPSIASADTLRNQLQQLGHSGIVSGRGWNLASANPGIINYLGLAENRLFGSPVSLSELPQNSLEVADYILSQPDGNPVPHTTGRVTRFNHDFPTVTDLMTGDVLYSKSPDLNGDSQANQMVVLAKSRSSQTGEHIALILQQQDNDASISWMSVDSLARVMHSSPYIRFAAIRTPEAHYDKSLADYWSGKYPDLQSASTTEYYNSLPIALKTQFVASLRCTVDKMPSPVDHRREFIKAEIKKTFPRLNDSIANWWVDQPPHARDIYGTNDLAFNLYIFGSNDAEGNPLKRVTTTRLFEFLDQQKTDDKSIADLINSHHGSRVLDDLVLVTPESPQDLSLADIVFINRSEKITKPRIGVVTDKSSELKTMFYDWNGEGVPQELDSTEIAKFIGKPKNEVVVLRTTYEHYKEQIRLAVEPTKLKYADLPPEITHSHPGSMIDFPSIPLFARLQNDVINATDLASRSHAIQQILANIGVETSDYAEYNHGTRWSEDGVWKCIDYSRTAFQAIVKDGWRHLSNWTDHDKPTYGTGRNIGSAEISVWLNKYGEKYGFENVTNKSRDYRLQRLAAGDIMYGAEYVNGGGSWHGIGDTWLIYGMPGKHGEVIPVYTKASGNHLGDYPMNIYWFDDPGYYFGPRGPANTQTWDVPMDFNAGILFSYKIPLKQIEPEFDGRL